MIKRAAMFAIIACIIFPFLLTGCTHSKEQNEITIGVAWPFKNNNNLFNEGIDLAVDQINDDGGINGKELKLLKEDDEANAVKGMAIAESFAENKKIQAVIGHCNSFVSIPASAIYDNARLVMLSPASTAVNLTQDGYTHIFRNIPSDNEIAEQLAAYLAEQGLRRMVIYYSNDAYGIGLSNCFEDYANKNGITIVDRFNSYTGSEDLIRLKTRWQAFGADGIFIADTLSDGGKFISDAGEADIGLPFFAGNSLDSDLLSEIAGTNSEGTIISSVFNPSSERAEVKKFVTDFYDKYNKMPSSYAALGYDSVNILAAAMKISKSYNRSEIAAELMNLEKWSGVTGIHEFDKNGDDLGDLAVIKKYVSGKFTSLEK